ALSKNAINEESKNIYDTNQKKDDLITKDVIKNTLITKKKSIASDTPKRRYYNQEISHQNNSDNDYADNIIINKNSSNILPQIVEKTVLNDISGSNTGSEKLSFSVGDLPILKNNVVQQGAKKITINNVELNNNYLKEPLKLWQIGFFGTQQWTWLSMNKAPSLED